MKWKKPGSFWWIRLPGFLQLFKLNNGIMGLCFLLYVMQYIFYRHHIHTDYTYSVTLRTFLCPIYAHGSTLTGDCPADWNVVIHNITTKAFFREAWKYLYKYYIYPREMLFQFPIAYMDATAAKRFPLRDPRSVFSRLLQWKTMGNWPIDRVGK